MADESASIDSADPPASEARAGVPASLSQLWQVPVLLLGLGLFAVGLWAIRPVAVQADVDAVLDDVDRLLVAGGAENIAEAGEQLTRVHQGFEEIEPSEEQRGRYWQYAGDRVYLQQANGGGTEARDINHGRVLEDYERAEEHGRTLDARSQRWRALSLVDLGRTEDALAALEAMGPEAVRERLAVLKDMIERRQEAAASREEAAEDPVLASLLERFRERVATLRDPAERLRQQRWLTAARARRLLAAGAFDRAVDLLSREVMQLRSAAGAGAATSEPELTMLLAEAHRGLENLDMADRLYRQAQREFSASDPLGGDTLLGLAAVAEARARNLRERVRDALNTGAGSPAGSVALPPEALDALELAAGLYAQAVAGFPGDRRALDARLGLARVSTFRDPPPEALEAWRLAVRQLVEETSDVDPRRDAAAAALSEATDRALDDTRYEDALDLLEAVTPLFGQGVPASLLLRGAQTREKLAERRMIEGAEASGPARGQAFREAASGFAAAGDDFREHARRLETVDPEASALSLWQSARAYDRAERWDQAIRAYDRFLQEAPDGAIVQEASHQLGLAYLANGDAAAAVDRLSALIAESPTSRWAFASVVPLARAQLATDQEEAAIQTLLQALDHNPAITPDSPVYRDALITLGRVLFLRAREDARLYPDAIARLEEAEQRFGSDERAPEIRYLLADALRRSIASLDADADAASVAEERPAAERLALAAERTRRLRRAGDLFAQVRHALEARDEASLTPLLSLYRRNAWFYQADCAYLAGDYAAAIPLYREASERWAGDPAALVAQVQIVNAHCELGEFAAAAVANRRALLLLNRLDDSAFESPDLPMDRRHWQDWLRWSSELDLFASAEAENR